MSSLSPFSTTLTTLDVWNVSNRLRADDSDSDSDEGLTLGVMKSL